MSSALADRDPAPLHRFGLNSADVLPVVIALAALASGLSGQQPTGNSVADFALAAGLGASLVWLSRWATPRSLLMSAVLGLFFTGLQMPFVLVAIVAVASALFVTSWRRLDNESYLIGAAVTAALVSQVVLNLPNVRLFGSASALALIAVLPLIWTAGRRLPARTRTITLVVLAAAMAFAVAAAGLALYAALSVRNSVEIGIDQAQAGVEALEAGDQGAAVALLTAAQQNFQNASGRLESPITWPARFVPVVAQHSRALETAANQGAALARTAARTVTSADVDQIRGRNGALDLDLIGELNAELTNANVVLRDAQASLFDVRTSWLLPQLDSRLAEVQVELASTNEDIDLANQATSVLPGILGADSPRRYLVLFLQPAESREFGGFVGAYGILEADGGRLNLAESGSIKTDLGNSTAEFTNPPDFPVSYRSLFPELNLQNLSGIADLPTIARAARDVVPQRRGDNNFSIDGVVTIDPYGLAGLLELTGPIPIPSISEVVNSDTVVDFLLRDQYIAYGDADPEERHDALGELAAAAFDQLLQIEIPGPERLGAVFGPIARANRIGFVTFDEAENRFLERVFLSGAMPLVDESVEMIGVYGATGVASKLDAYSTRSMTYGVTVDPASGSVRGEMDITITNEVPPDANGYVLGAADDAISLAGEPLTLGDNLVAISIYSRSSIEEIRSRDASFVTGEVSPALGYDRSTIFLEVPAQTARHITFNTESRTSPGRYDLLITAQQTANIGDFTLILRPAPGWRVVNEGAAADGSWTSTTPLDVSSSFSFVFERAD